MPSEFGAIRVQPLQLVLEGRDPVEYLHDFLNQEGNALLYVRTPDGFRCDYWKEFSAVGPLGFKGASKTKIERDAAENERFPSYMRLDRNQLQALLARGAVNLDAFNAGGLFLRLKEDQAPSIDFDAMFAILSVKLEPTSRGVGHATPTAFDPAKGHGMVVKSFDDRSKEYSYGLHGVTFRDLWIGTEVPVEQRTPPLDAVDAAAPDDPYNLKESSPFVYAILKKAFEWRDRPRSEMKIKKLAGEFEAFNTKPGTNLQPFMNGRDELAVRLANRGYNGKAKRQGYNRIITEVVPDGIGFFNQSFVNRTFSKVLYVACRWGSMEPSLDGDPKGLRDLLVGLGFWDVVESDEVYSLMYLISGTTHKREGDLAYKHSSVSDYLKEIGAKPRSLRPPQGRASASTTRAR